jgi:hypothetical protein
MAASGADGKPEENSTPKRQKKKESPAQGLPPGLSEGRLAGRLDRHPTEGQGENPEPCPGGEKQKRSPQKRGNPGGKKGGQEEESEGEDEAMSGMAGMSAASQNAKGADGQSAEESPGKVSGQNAGGQGHKKADQAQRENLKPKGQELPLPLPEPQLPPEKPRHPLPHGSKI